VRSNEKPCVCNVFATPHSKNPVKSSIPSYPNVNFSSARDNKKYYKKINRTLENSVFSRVSLCLNQLCESLKSYENMFVTDK